MAARREGKGVLMERRRAKTQRAVIGKARDSDAQRDRAGEEGRGSEEMEGSAAARIQELPNASEVMVNEGNVSGHIQREWKWSSARRFERDGAYAWRGETTAAACKWMSGLGTICFCSPCPHTSGMDPRSCTAPHMHPVCSAPRDPSATICSVSTSLAVWPLAHSPRLSSRAPANMRERRATSVMLSCLPQSESVDWRKKPCTSGVSHDTSDTFWNRPTTRWWFHTNMSRSGGGDDDEEVTDAAGGGEAAAALPRAGDRASAAFASSSAHPTALIESAIVSAADPACPPSIDARRGNDAVPRLPRRLVEGLLAPWKLPECSVRAEQSAADAPSEEARGFDFRPMFD
eukprot:2946661-Pleurochrysis_carterae.AAC.3